MTDTTPPPTPGDTLVASVIRYVAIIAILCVLVIAMLLMFDKAVPQILESIATISVTGVVSLLAGRTQR